ncbi:MAG TPA: glutaredoxin family protein, partial [Candidatus Hydrogenedentes bacterium]|jgi:glutaredoxin|nr:MAG: Glutaredoxin [Candidatus Hydrogenedentes bacterium ADurb.Bin170]HNZ48210.1 glutaredoxin family protein [Candidatus Hydrogenedentota bacterium]HOD96233.1 glutaredoxin family protein [Candidatus Hydrogenedentota bacterium]HOM48608.1 glutaredoxin family protein [Candidatus Hydrogenedentota bacterium]HOR50695.1 glutaredoxin family protein [Candidatus Hydrogenedentota bacterium]
MQKIIVYSADFCSDCQHLRAWMDKEGIAYEVRDIRKDPEHARTLEEKTGKQGVPFLIIDGEWKRGYEPGKAFSEAFARSLFNR